MLLVLIILPLVGLFVALFLLLLLLIFWLLLIIDRLVVLHLFRVAKEVADLFLTFLLVHHLLFIDARSVINIILLFRQVLVFLVLTFADVLLILGVFSFDLYFFALFSIIGVLAVLLLVVVLVLDLSFHLLIDFHPIGAVVFLREAVLHVSEVLLRFW